MTELVVAQCYYLDFDDRNRNKPIYVYLNSTGCINDKVGEGAAAGGGGWWMHQRQGWCGGLLMCRTGGVGWWMYPKEDGEQM